MSISKLFIAASLLVSPVALAKNNPSASSTKTTSTATNSDGYRGVGSNPKDSSDDRYGNGKGSNQEASRPNEGYAGKGSNPSDSSTYYVPDNQYQDDDVYYYNAAGYVPASDVSGQKKVTKDHGAVEVGLRYAVGKGLDVSPELTGGGLYARAFEPGGRYAIELSLDSLSSDPTSGVNMKQGNLLVSYALFLNPDGNWKPYGSVGVGGTWHGVAGNQNIFGALALGVGLDVALGKTISLNLDGRLIADSEANGASPNTDTTAAISPSTLNSPQEFVVSSAGLSFHF